METEICERSNGAVYAACPCGWESANTDDGALNLMFLRMEANEHEDEAHGEDEE